MNCEQGRISWTLDMYVDTNPTTKNQLVGVAATLRHLSSHHRAVMLFGCVVATTSNGDGHHPPKSLWHTGLLGAPDCGALFELMSNRVGASHRVTGEGKGGGRGHTGALRRFECTIRSFLFFFFGNDNSFLPSPPPPPAALLLLLVSPYFAR